MVDLTKKVVVLRFVSGAISFVPTVGIVYKISLQEMAKGLEPVTPVAVISNFHPSGGSGSILCETPGQFLVVRNGKWSILGTNVMAVVKAKFAMKTHELLFGVKLL